MNVELAIIRLAKNLAAVPEYAATARVLEQLYVQHGLPLEVGRLKVAARHGGVLVATVDGQVVASSTTRKNAARVQRGEGTEGRKRRSVNVDDATWNTLKWLADRDHEGNVSEAFRQLVRRAR
jgi:hypothetical protein